MVAVTIINCLITTHIMFSLYQISAMMLLLISYYAFTYICNDEAISYELDGVVNWYFLPVQFHFKVRNLFRIVFFVGHYALSQMLGQSLLGNNKQNEL